MIYSFHFYRNGRWWTYAMPNFGLFYVFLYDFESNAQWFVAVKCTFQSQILVLPAPLRVTHSFSHMICFYEGMWFRRHSTGVSIRTS